MEIITEIINIQYEDYTNTFTIEFITEEDGDEFIRVQEMNTDDFKYYYPDRINLRRWEEDIDNNNVIVMLEQYYEDGIDFPIQQLR